MRIDDEPIRYCTECGEEIAKVSPVTGLSIMPARYKKKERCPKHLKIYEPRPQPDRTPIGPAWKMFALIK